MERDNLTEQARALNAAVAVIKEYCESRTADDACRKCLFRDNCGGEPYTWGNEPPHPAGRAGKRGGAVAEIVKAIRPARKIAVYRTGDVVRVEVEGAGRGDIPAAVKAAKGRDTEDAE